MENETKDSIKLGVFVTVALILLIASIYLIGSKNNIFTTNFKLVAKFKEVGGLQGGNLVRFRGINIGTVEGVTIMNDSTVAVLMKISRDAKKHLKKSAVASIGSDGLMGNALVNIGNKNMQSPEIGENDTIKTLEPVAIDEVFHTLKKSNDNIFVITEELKTTMKKLNGKNTLWSVLADTLLAGDITQAFVSIKATGDNTEKATGNISDIVKKIKNGQGSLGALLVDTGMARKLKQAISNIHVTSSNAAEMSGDLSDIMKKINKGNGAIGALLMDTSVERNLKESMKNINAGTANFNQDMEALKHSFLLRNYFRKKAGEKK